MSKQCKFKCGDWNCGSYQFNLYKNDIDQGDLCDVHYWQTKAQRPWVGLTAQEAVDCWSTSVTKIWHNFEAALKEKNT
jgi:hypothetical protein